MKKLLLLLLILFSANSFAENLQPSDLQLIEAAGVPLYEKATFVYGNKDVGFRFATSVPQEETQQWYQEQLPKWELFEKYGSWIMYDGKPGAGMGELMSMNQISIQKNDNLPQWHSLDQKMTTEIVIMIVK